MRDDTTRNHTDYRLAPLEKLDGYHVADGEIDPRGWDVRAADGRRIGEVDSLIADTGAMKVRYLDVELDRKELDLPEDRHVLIPIGGATLDEKEDFVRLSTLPASQISRLQPYSHGEISRDDEHRVMSHFDSRYTPAPYTDFYSHQNFSDSRFFGGRRRDRETTAYLVCTDQPRTQGESNAGRDMTDANRADARR